LDSKSAAFSRMRRAEIGHHHHIAANIFSAMRRSPLVRKDNLGVANCDQLNCVAKLALTQSREGISAIIGSDLKQSSQIKIGSRGR
jgi:hypothetical protein